MNGSIDSRQQIEVAPLAACDRFQNLLKCLEQVFPVRFKAVDSLSNEAPGIRFEASRCWGEEERPPSADLLFFAASSKIGNQRAAKRIELSGARLLETPFRAMGLEEPDLPGDIGLEQEGEGQVLAAWEQKPVWLAGASGPYRRDLLAVEPRELADDEGIMTALGGGGLLGFLGLIFFLRRVCIAQAWTPPPIRASFLFDDPNLHWATYGHVDYRKLIEHAEAHDYHAAMAMIPLDTWFHWPAAKRLFTENPKRISLLMHGNSHIHHELRNEDSEALRRLLAQGLRRIDRFERKTGVPVSRIMAPPHERCSKEALRQMALLGYDAGTSERTGEWLPQPFEKEPMGEWYPSEWHEAGIPVFIRHHFDSGDLRLALAAWLGQPLIVYGHDCDLADGLDILADWAGRINRMGKVQWMSLQDMGLSNYLCRQEEDRLIVRPFSRRMRVRIPAGVAAVELEIPSVLSNAEGLTIQTGHGAMETPSVVGATGRHVISRGDVDEVELTLRVGETVDPYTCRNPSRQLIGVMRRGMTELRDRVRPLRR